VAGAFAGLEKILATARQAGVGFVRRSRSKKDLDSSEIFAT